MNFFTLWTAHGHLFLSINHSRARASEGAAFLVASPRLRDTLLRAAVRLLPSRRRSRAAEATSSLVSPWVKLPPPSGNTHTSQTTYHTAAAHVSPHDHQIFVFPDAFWCHLTSGRWLGRDARVHGTCTRHKILNKKIYYSGDDGSMSYEYIGFFRIFRYFFYFLKKQTN